MNWFNPGFSEVYPGFSFYFNRFLLDFFLNIYPQVTIFSVATVYENSLKIRNKNR